MRATIHALLLVALSLGAGTCSSTPSSCLELCAELSDCGMLPGPLGASQPRRSAIQDCDARCSISTKRDELQTCFNTVSPMNIEGEDPWCDRGHCSEAASCLRTALESNVMLGVGSVHVSATDDVPEVVNDECPALLPNEPMELSFLAERCKPMNPLTFADPFQVASSDTGTTSDAGATSDTSTGDDPMRDQTQTTYEVYPARFVLDLISDHEPDIAVADGDCGSVAGHPYVPNVPVGTYRTRLRVYGNDTSHCVQFEGALFTVTAEQTTNATFWLTDTDPDTEEPILPTLCPESDAVRCRNGLDDDNDGATDCEDSDCEESGECDSDRYTDDGGVTSDVTSSSTGMVTTGGTDTDTTGGTSPGGASAGT